MRCLFGSRTSLDTTLAPIGFYCNNAGTHGIKPSISLSFDLNGDRIFLRLLFWRGGEGLVFSGRTPETVSPVPETSSAFHFSFLPLHYFSSTSIGRVFGGVIWRSLSEI